MRNIDEEIEGWKDLLYRDIIDEKTYKTEVEKLKKESILYGDNLYKILQKIIAIVLILYIVNSMFLEDLGNPYEYVESLDNLSSPIQVDWNGGTAQKVDGENVNIDFVKKYTMCGRVVDVQKYFGVDMFEKISPVDIGMAWGIVGNEANKDKVDWKSYGDRFLISFTIDDGWLSEIGGVSNMGLYHSNNHLIPADKNIEKLMKSIDEGDYVKVEGFLVNVTFNENGRTAFIDSSISRSDSGGGACETIYVTDIKWLKEK